MYFKINLVGPAVKKIQELRVGLQDYEFIKILAQGAFGTVSLIRSKLDKQLYALKTLNKQIVLRQENVFYFEERNVMVKGKECEWITTLMSAFQDATNLYLVMEYIPGGDLINLLENDAFQGTNIEDVARFYGAEILLAIEELHSMNFIHRDLKPHNILIKKNGHIKLADFGAAIQLDPDNKCRSKVSVGTPDYICPEILKATDGNVSYGKECDWWSFGTILYEIVCGDPPFYAENLSTTYGKIMSSPNSLVWPEDVTLSGELKDLLFKLLLPADKRLGKNGVEEVKKHPFFRKIDFSKIRSLKPPFVPNLATEDDTSNFPDFEDDILGQDLQRSKPQVGLQLPFIGFYFNRGNMLNDGHKLLLGNGQASPSTSNKMSTFEAEEKNVEIRALQELNAKVTAEVTSLKKEFEKAQQSNKELLTIQAEKDKIDKNLKEARKEMKDMVGFLDKNHAKIEDLDKQIKNLKSEKEELDLKSRESSRSYESTKLQLENLEVMLKQRDMELEEERKRMQSIAYDQSDSTGELEKVKTKYNEEVKIKEKLLVELTELNTRFSTSNKLTAELEQRVSMMETMQQSQVAENATLQEHLEKKSHDVEKLTAAKFDLEKKITMSEHEVKNYQAKLEELKGKNKTLEDQIMKLLSDGNKGAQKSSEQSDMSKDKIDGLLNKLKASENELEALHRLLAKSDTTKNSLQADLKMMEEKLHNEKKLKSDLEERLAEKESQLKEERQNALMVHNDYSMKEFLYKELGDKLEKVQKEKDDTMKFMENLNSEKNILQKEIHSLKHNTNNETKIRHDFEERIRSKEKEILLCKARLAEKDTQNFELENNCEDFKRIVASKDEFVRAQDTEINKLTDELKSIKEEFTKMKVDFDSNEKRIIELIHARDAEKRKAEAMYSEQEGLFLRLASMEKELKSSKTAAGGGKRERGEIRELLQQLELANKKIKDLESLKSPADNNSLKSPDTISLNPREIPQDNDFSQLMLMGEDPSSLRPPMGRERRKSSYEIPLGLKVGKAKDNPTPQIKRKLTVSASITVEGKGELFLRGWVQMPKTDKLNKGLRKKFLILKDFQVWGYEREKDLNDEGKGSVLSDIKSEIFVVSQVGIHELGGLSAKEFDLAFKIQYMKLPGISTQKDSMASLAPTKLSNGQKLLQLRRRIAAEERMQLAAEKYLNFAAEGAKPAVRDELNKSRDLISSIDQEIQAILEKDPNVEVEEKTSQHISYIEKVEKAIEREEQFIQGVKKMSSANFWKKAGDDLNKELQNSLKRLAHLRMELERWKKDNDVVLASIQELDTAKIPENGHYFKEGYVKQEVLCDLCLEFITGNPVQISQCDSIY